MKSLHYITLRAFVYATEGEDRVRRALGLFVPEDVEVGREETEGHYGNPIVILDAKMDRADDMREFLGLLQSLPAHDQERLYNEMEERLDDDLNLHVRFDKQRAYEGQVALAVGSDSIDAGLRIAAYPAKRELGLEVARELLDEILRF